MSPSRWTPFALLVILIAFSACRSESSAAAERTAEAADPFATLNPAAKLAELHPSIPIYPGATYAPDLTRRDTVTIRNQFGPEAEVFTLATNDSFPKVYHYYVTYLSLYRAYNPPRTAYPSTRQQWRSIRLALDEIMHDSFIPGDDWLRDDRQVVLQVNETDGRAILIRYIVAPRGVTIPADDAQPPATDAEAEPPPEEPGAEHEEPVG